MSTVDHAHEWVPAAWDTINSPYSEGENVRRTLVSRWVCRLCLADSRDEE